MQQPSEPVPIVTGASGLTGRPAVRPAYEPEVELLGDRDPSEQPAQGVALPAPCLRLLHTLNAGSTCAGDCPGMQRDGGCLVDIVRAAQQAGVAWAFDVDADGYWNYIGAELAES